MKKLSLYILLIATVLTSCNKDDDSQNEETNPNQDLITGKWYVTNIIIDGDALLPGDCELESTLDINSDGTFEEQTYGGFTGGECSPDTLDKGTWKLSENTLTMTLNELGNATNLTSINTILELTEKTLKYEFEGEDILSDGTVVPFKEVWTYSKEAPIPNPVQTSKLVGIWDLIYRKQSNVASEDNLDDCRKKSFMEFKSNNTYIEKEYFNITNNNCQIDHDVSGPWSTSEDILTLSYTENGETITEVPKFQITNNELSITYNDEGVLIEYRFRKR